MEIFFERFCTNTKTPLFGTDSFVSNRFGNSLILGFGGMLNFLG